jgi:hypothetical protein
MLDARYEAYFVKREAYLKYREAYLVKSISHKYEYRISKS